MKRLLCLLIVLTAVSIAVVCSAQSVGFTCGYTPKTETGSVFYIDIAAQVETAAAVMELSFDAGIAEFRGASAVQKTSAVRARCDDHNARIAFADSGAVTGNLVRVSFKALEPGSCMFRLHIVQAVDGELRYYDAFDDYSLEVKLGKEDVSEEKNARSAAVKKTPSSASASSSASRSRRISLSSEREDREEGDASKPSAAGFTDLRRDSVWKYIFIGAGAVIMSVLSVVLGIVAGRKLSRQDKEHNDSLEAAKTEPEDETDNDEDLL